MLTVTNDDNQQEDTKMAVLALLENVNEADVLQSAQAMAHEYAAANDGVVIHNFYCYGECMCETDEPWPVIVLADWQIDLLPNSAGRIHVDLICTDTGVCTSGVVHDLASLNSFVATAILTL